MKKWILLFAAAAMASAASAATDGYAVVVSAATAGDAGWAKVVAALKAKHQAAVVVSTNIFGAASRDELRRLQPRYVAFVARPEEIGVEFVQKAHRLSRGMDADPYGDFIWGIVTAATPSAALRIAGAEAPLVVRRAVSTTGINAGPLDECLTISDGRPGDYMLKSDGKTFHGSKTNDNVAAYKRFLDYYQTNDVDLLVTSSHSTQVNLEMPFTDGSIVISGDKMFMVDKEGLFSFVRAASGKEGSGLWFQSAEGAVRRAEWAGKTAAPLLRRAMNPKIYIAAGNCLIGDVMNTTDSLVINWLSSQGVNQFVGYTVPTWFGRGGWGTLELWQDFGGQNNVAEAFYLNNQRIVHTIAADFPDVTSIDLDKKSLEIMVGERRGAPTAELIKLDGVIKNTPSARRKEMLGNLYDRDVVAMYGDPKWDARLDAGKAGTPVKWRWSGEGGNRTLEIEALKNFTKDSLPILLPSRMPGAQVASDGGLKVFLNDEFILLSNLELTAGQTCRITLKTP